VILSLPARDVISVMLVMPDPEEPLKRRLAVTTHEGQRDRMLLEAARRACLQAAVDAYEDAGIRGLCGEGRWEYAIAAVRALDLDAVRTATLANAPVAGEDPPEGNRG
jgi:hypothetical protein